MSWCTIESDPGVFTELIETIGVKGVQVEEIYSLDDDSFSHLKPVYGLIFLFKWVKQNDSGAPVQYVDDPSIFFANQVVNNACATQAILSILMNSPTLDLGETVSDLKAFTQEFPPELKGVSIGNCEQIRKAHNSFARAEPFVSDEKATADDKDDVYHFVAYIPHNGRVYELDGLKRGPVLLGEASEDNWLDAVRPAIQSRIESYSQSEIRFNLLALVKNRKQACEEKIAQLSTEMGTAEGGRQAEITAAIEEHQATIASEEAKFTNWREENKMRRHNYIPFIVAMLKVLAKKKKLGGLVEKARTRGGELRAAAMKKKADEQGAAAAVAGQ